jgi:hypothetical protein|tara:strand:+ start:843 stop:1328 length:486 start_codon:yes stop_codon:yes gene_type:complete
MFFWLESTPLALWVSLSFWAYPVLLSVHIVGLSIVAGIYAMRDLRCLGVVSEPPLLLFVRFHRLALVGLGLNVASGFLLFSSQATVLIQSVPFLIKMVCVGLASAIALIIHARFSAAIAEKAHVIESNVLLESRTMQRLSALSLALWLSAIVAGRLIAYIF